MYDGMITLYFDEDAWKKLQKDHQYYNNKVAISHTIKKIILNHADTYKEESEELKNHITSSFASADVSADGYDIEDVAWLITKYIGNSKATKALPVKTKKKRKKKFPIRLNNNSSADSRIEIILEARPSYAGESDYLGSIINSYLELPQTEREKVIYKDEVQNIEFAVKHHRYIRFKSKGSGKIRKVLPEGIHNSDEEIYNYCLYSSEDKAVSIHLYNMSNVTVEAEIGEFNDTVKEQFDCMKRNGIQFNFDDHEIIKVRLTDDGIKQLNYRYLEKPDILPSSDPEHHIYCFDCGATHFKNYFSPFYSEVTVLEPVSLKEELIQKYKDSLSNYNDIIKDHQ